MKILWKGRYIARFRKIFLQVFSGAFNQVSVISLHYLGTGNLGALLVSFTQDLSAPGTNTASPVTRLSVKKGETTSIFNELFFLKK